MNANAQCERSGNMGFVNFAVTVRDRSLQVGNGASYAPNSVIAATRQSSPF
jgi:hypothetical protein